MEVIRARLGDHVNHSSARASQFHTVGVGRDAKFLHHFCRNRVGSAVKSASLGEETVVEVAAIDQKAVLEPANASEREIAIGGRSQAARVLRDARRKQRQVGKSAAVERNIGERAFIENGGNRAGLGVDQRRRV